MKAVSSQVSRFWQGLPIRSRGLVILTIPVVCLLAAVGVFGSYQSLLAQNKRQVLEVKQMKLLTKAILVALSTAETGIQNYGLTRNPAFLKTYQAAIANLPESVSELQRLPQNSAQQRTIAEIEELIDRSLSKLKSQHLQIDTLQQPLDSAQTYRWLQQDDEVLNQTRQTIDRLITQEDQRLEQFQQALTTQQERGLRLIWIVLGIGILAATLAIVLLCQLTQELCQREEQLQQANLQLQQANDRLQRFTADASHELRAPVAAILGQAQAGLLATDDARTPRQRLQKIVDITKSMATLVNNLLFLARHTETRFSVPAIDIVPLLTQLSETYVNAAVQHQIHFSATIPDVPVMAQVEPDLLKQAIANLLDNALRYTPPAGKVQLEVMQYPDSLSIRVTDTGIGIPATDLSHIFDRFYRVDRVRSKTGGFGLGLAIAQQIVQSFGGNCTVNSEVGKGSQFEILLPRESIAGDPQIPASGKDN